MLLKRFLLAASMLLTVTACTHDAAATLSPPEAYAQVQAGTLTLIDVRHADEWRETGVARGALRIDMTNTQGEAGFVHQVMTQMSGDRNAPIGLLGLSSNRAVNASKVLREAGFTQVFVIQEGMQGSSGGPGWIARGLPVDPCPDC